MVPSSRSDILEHRKAVLATLGFEQMDSRRSTVKDAQRTTCEWMAHHPAYVAWRCKEGGSEGQRTLWIAGKPGAGKSTIMKYLYKDTEQNKHHDEIVISFFFNARGEELEKSTVGMYRALLYQILKEVPDLQTLLDKYSSSNDWTTESLKDAITTVIGGLGHKRLTCFIDALDECDEQQIRDMVDHFDDIQDSTPGGCNGLFICFASRHYPTIEIRSGQRLVLEQEDGHSEDLWKYIRRRLRAGKGKLVEDIQAQVHDKANGVFMWVVLVINILNEEFSRGRIFAVKQRLREIPSDLSALFRDLLHRDNVNMDDLLLCIQWVLFARRPLSMEEFYFAMVAGLYPEQVPEAWNQEEITRDHMRLFVQSSSKGLAELTKSKRAPQVQFIHESVNDYLVKDGGLRELWPGLGEDEQLHSVSHERLKRCCLHQLAADTSIPVSSFTAPLPKAKSEEAKRLREATSTKFPFIAYASSEILFHANEAAHAIPQDTFLEEFPLGRWVDTSNVYEPHEVRRHGFNVTLLYVLAEKGFDLLIRTVGTCHLWQRLPYEKYQYPVIAAFCHGHEDTLRALLDGEAEVTVHAITNDRGFGNTSPPRKNQEILLWAADAGNWALAECLLYARVEGDLRKRQLARNQSGDDAMSLAARYGKTTVLTLLSPCKVRSVHLMSACVAGHTECVQLLLDWGADVNGDRDIYLDADTKTTYLSPIEAAAARGCEDAVQLLLDRGADVSTNGSDVLAVASKTGREALVKLLLDCGAWNDPLGHKGTTALRCAVVGGFPTVVEMLLEHGAIVNVEATDRRATNVSHDDLVRLFLDPDADANSPNREGTALVAACDGGFQRTVEVLLDHYARVNAQGRHYHSAIEAACSKGDETMLRLLLDRGANLHAQDKDFGGALREACTSGQETMLRLLLDHGADANAICGLYGTALRYACYYGHMTIVRLLLDRGADVNTWDPGSGNVLRAATSGVSSKEEAVVQLLREFGALPGSLWVRSPSAH